jgi:hypothetical protein
MTLGESVPPSEDAPLGEKVPLTQKQRMGIKRVGMPEQDATVRAGNFVEVNLGLTEQLAILEAERCLQCPKPYCIDGCPVRVNIPQFIRFLRDGDIKSAAASLLSDNVRDRPRLPAGEPVREAVPAREDGLIGGHRTPRAIRRRLGTAACRRNRHRGGRQDRQERGDRRLGAGRPHRCR